MFDILCLKIYLAFLFLPECSTNTLTLDLRNFACCPQPSFLLPFLVSSSAHTFCSGNLSILSFLKLAMFCPTSLHLQMLLLSSGKPFPKLPRAQQMLITVSSVILSNTSFTHLFFHYLTNLCTFLKTQVKFHHSYEGFLNSLCWDWSHCFSAFIVLYM